MLKQYISKDFVTNISKWFIKCNAIAILASNYGASAQGFTPTAEHIELFKNLPLEQQHTLALQYGVDLSTIDNNLLNSGPMPSPITVEPRTTQTNQSNKITNVSTIKQEKTLERFGLELFAGKPQSFDMTNDVLIPSNYVVSAGDEIVVQLFGKENNTLKLKVNLSGVIQFPSLGPINVAGLTFSEVKDSLNKRIKEQMIGVSSDISLGELRTMQIFVMGDTYQPGAYTVSSYTTISQAIYYSGGFNDSGALRHVQLKRNGKVISTLDLYDLLLNGDASNDVRLSAGDVVFIGAVGSTITIAGEINRPAIYEIKTGDTYLQAIELAGGFSSNADQNKIEIKRYAKDGERQVLTLNFTNKQDRKLKVQNGDVITVYKQTGHLTNYIKIEGDVAHTGVMQWKKGMRVADLFTSLSSAFNPTADVEYAIIVREINEQKDIAVLQVNLARAILNQASEDNLQLERNDRLLVFNRLSNTFLEKLSKNKAKSLEQAKQQAAQEQQETSDGLKASTQLAQSSLTDQNHLLEVSKITNVDAEQNTFNQEELDKLKKNTRAALLAPILLKLQQQARLGIAPQIVEITGEVKYPGHYPITQNMRISNLLEASGGLNYSAYTAHAELTSKIFATTDESVDMQLTHIDLRQVIAGNQEFDLSLNGLDKINILEKPNVKLNNRVVLQGEVRFPGTYILKQGETLREIIARAGGLTDLAYAKGAIFTREALRLQEQKLLEQYANEIREEVAKKAFRADGSSISSISNPEKTLTFVEEVSKSKALGRMVIELDKILQTNADSVNNFSVDFMLEDDDFLYVPTYRNTVSIIGEVQVPITYLLDPTLDIDDYLNKAGGTKKQADEDLMYVIRTDGSVYKPSSGYWFGDNDNKLQAGDTIVVPIDTNYRDGLSTWTAATQILYQTGVAVNALR